MNHQAPTLRAKARWVRYVAVLALIPPLMLGGCSAVKIRLGLRVSLAKTDVTAMQVSLPKGPAIAPGEKLGLVVNFTQPNGKPLATEGQAKGKVLWKDLIVTPSVVTADQKGNVTLPHDPRKSDGKTAHVTITAPSHPDLRTELDIPVTYDYNFLANFKGSAGPDGFNGTDGTNGTNGSPGSLDPNNPSPGGDGGNGTDGGNGQDGGDGGDAPAVQVLITLRPGAHSLLQMSVTAAGKRRLYLVDPQGGALYVNADGGAGGSGGKGGSGGSGGSGGVGSPNGNNGRSGSGGTNGSDGRAGKGGSITVTYDPHAKPFLNAAIHLANHGGPTPVFIEAPVPPLW